MKPVCSIVLSEECCESNSLCSTLVGSISFVLHATVITAAIFYVKTG